MPDLVELYFNEIPEGELSREEEVELAQRIEQGDQQARKKLARANLRLVINIANDYRNYRGVEYLDLIGAGNVGLMIAIDKFDWRKGYKFSTYAYWWIRRKVLTHIRQNSRTIRLPYRYPRQLRELRKVKAKFKRKHDRKPTTKELFERTEFSLEKIKRLQQAPRSTGSLDQPLNNDQQERTKATLIPAQEKNQPGKKTKEEQWRGMIKRLMDNSDLTDRKRQILRLRYGLEDYQPRTLNEVGKIFNLSRERIRQLQDEAIKELKPTKSD